MTNKDDLLNLNNKKNLKKPLIYGAVAFLVFIIAVLGFAIYNNSASKQDNVVLPPQINEEKKESMFKEVPIEESEKANKNSESLADKILKHSDTEENAKVNEQNNTLSQPKQEKKDTAKPEVKKAANKPTPKKQATAEGNYYVQVAALMKYKKPNQKFLNLIKKEGYNYKRYETFYIKNGKKIEVVKILIGPFKTRAQAQKELKRIKETITQNAFIYKVK